MSGYHTHPKPVVSKVYGRRLTCGVLLKKGDVYDSSSGRWEEIPEFLIGQTIEAGCETYFVRLEKKQE